IPGSSLKGKMRSLLELNEGCIGNKSMGKVKNGPNDHDLDKKAPKLFGSSSGDEKQRPSKILVRDAHILAESGDFADTDLPFTETKTEVVIDRITSAASPRQIERVPAGAKFELNIVINVFNEDNEGELVNSTFTALQLVQDDYLGGNGSRGYGQVSFEIDSITERSAAYYEDPTTGETTYKIAIPETLKAEVHA
ncbi:MAG: type III-A CRISPR-associated RAMP protein Csm3, partial [Bacteroidota bacterium]